MKKKWNENINIRQVCFEWSSAKLHQVNCNYSLFPFFKSSNMNLFSAFFAAIFLVGCTSVCAQTAPQVSTQGSQQPWEVAPNLWEHYVLGVGVAPKSPAVFAELYPVILASGGFAANAGYETGHWQFGGTYLSLSLSDGFRDWFLADASGVDVSNNTAIECIVSYFIRSDRQGLYVGIIGGPDWYRIRDRATGAEETLMRVYVVPRVGLRWFPFQPYLYVDTAFGVSLNLSGSETRTLGAAQYSARSALAFPFLQVGVSVPLGDAAK